MLFIEVEVTKHMWVLFTIQTADPWPVATVQENRADGAKRNTVFTNTLLGNLSTKAGPIVAE